MPQYRSSLLLLPTRPVSGVPDDGLTFDATTQATVEQQGRAIRHPKQSGSEDLVDDVDVEPTALSFTAHFTDTPLYYDQLAAGEGRAVALADALAAIQTAKVRCTVFFRDRVYPGMVIERRSEPYDAETGDGVDVDFSMVQVVTGTLKLVEAVPDAQTQALGQIVDIGYLP